MRIAARGPTHKRGFLMDKFHSEYQCEPHRVDQNLVQIGELYHLICDFYDSIICTGEGPDGGPMPAGPVQTRLVSRNANHVISYCELLGREHGYTSVEVRDMIKRIGNSRQYHDLNGRSVFQYYGRNIVNRLFVKPILVV